jgi:hypothetical protein
MRSGGGGGDQQQQQQTKTMDTTMDTEDFDPYDDTQMTPQQDVTMTTRTSKTRFAEEDEEDDYVNGDMYQTRHTNLPHRSPFPPPPQQSSSSSSSSQFSQRPQYSHPPPQQSSSPYPRQSYQNQNQSQYQPQYQPQPPPPLVPQSSSSSSRAPEFGIKDRQTRLPPPPPPTQRIDTPPPAAQFVEDIGRKPEPVRTEESTTNTANHVPMCLKDVTAVSIDKMPLMACRKKLLVLKQGGHMGFLLDDFSEEEINRFSEMEAREMLKGCL